MTAKFHLSEDVVCRETTGQLRMLFDRRKGVMYELNESATAVISLLEQQPATVDGLCTLLLEDFDAPADEVETDVSSLLADFMDAGLVIEE